MKLDTPVNEDYAARVVRVPVVLDLLNADRLKGVPLFGRQAVVGLDVKVGDLGVYFPAEVVMNDKYVRANNMFRHSDRNEDPAFTGYIEDNCRVKAVRLRGHNSDALFMPLSSLACFGKGWEELQEGDTFDHLNGEEVCRKYMRPIRYGRGFNAPRERIFAAVDERYFPQQGHITNFFYVSEGHLDPATPVVVTQKIHGSNIRIGNVLVQRKLSWLERLAKRFGVRVVTKEYSFVYGSHHAIKGLHNTSGVHFYDHDLWAEEGEKMSFGIPQGFVVYGEVIGFTDSGKPIQSHYTYDRVYHDADRRRSVYVYRVVQVSEEGIAVDLSWDAVRDFCVAAGFTPMPELYRGPLGGLDVESFLEKDFGFMTFPTRPVPLALDSPCDEGIVIRIEGMSPTFYKVKSPTFLQYETKMFDDPDSVDMESDESEPVLAEDIL